jgi:hypothetical protein
MLILAEPVPIGRIFLDLTNPRHVPFTTEDQAIEYLCEKEDVWPLARDIAAIGMNPMERVALLPIPGQKSSYTMAEGNRRLCALMLIADPDRAPAKLRKGFEGLAKQRAPIKELPAVLFDDQDEVRPWLERIHNGAQSGRGRKSWDAEQSQRYSGSQKNKLAQAFLDYAVKEGMLTEEQRKGKITTVQRFIGVDVLQEAMGIDQSNPDELSRTRPKAEFDLIAKRFIRDLLEGKEVNSRKNRPDVIKYARPLSSAPGVTATRIEPEPLSAPGGSTPATTPSRSRRTPRKLSKVEKVQYSDEIASALKGYGNHKLESLYNSICSIGLEHHTPLVCVGTWAFFETLTACAGRSGGTSFLDFMSNQRISLYGVTKEAKPGVKHALTRVSEYGNVSKHDPIAATFNGDQLNNDLVVLKPVIMKCIAEAAGRP